MRILISALLTLSSLSVFASQNRMDICQRAANADYAKFFSTKTNAPKMTYTCVTDYMSEDICLLVNIDPNLPALTTAWDGSISEQDVRRLVMTPGNVLGNTKNRFVSSKIKGGIASLEVVEPGIDSNTVVRYTATLDTKKMIGELTLDKFYPISRWLSFKNMIKGDPDHKDASSVFFFVPASSLPFKCQAPTIY